MDRNNRIFLVFTLIAYILIPDIIDLNNQPSLIDFFTVVIVAFFIPAFFEEIFFRRLLIQKFNIFWISVSLISFVLWHPLQCYLYLPEACLIFSNSKFLGLVFLLGLMTTYLYYRSKSLWPSIILHWLIVVTWKGLGGARFIY